MWWWWWGGGGGGGGYERGVEAGKKCNEGGVRDPPEGILNLTLATKNCARGKP